MSKFTHDEVKAGTFLMTFVPVFMLTFSLTRVFTMGYFTKLSGGFLAIGIVFTVLLFVYLTLKENQ